MLQIVLKIISNLKIENLIFKLVLKDKTFGMKNKKGAKAQKFIQTVQKQVINTNAPKRV